MNGFLTLWNCKKPSKNPPGPNNKFQIIYKNNLKETRNLRVDPITNSNYQYSEITVQNVVLSPYKQLVRQKKLFGINQKKSKQNKKCIIIVKTTYYHGPWMIYFFSYFVYIYFYIHAIKLTLDYQLFHTQLIFCNKIIVQQVKLDILNSVKNFLTSCIIY